MRLRNASLFAAAVAVVIFLHACSGKREEPRESVAPETTTAAPDSAGSSLTGMLPLDQSVPGWTRNGEVRSFGPDNLWQYIDGAAESYLSYGFEQVVTAEYAHSQMAIQATIDIYRMKDAKNAFGIYAAELNPDAEFMPIGAEGYASGTVLNFWAGVYYVKIIVAEERADIRLEMPKLARWVSSRLGPPGTIPPEAGYFPQENLIPHSIRYLPKDILGQSYLVSGFEARYRREGGEFKIVVISAADASSTREVLAKYRQFIGSSGKVAQDIGSPAEDGFCGADSFFGPMAVLRSGHRILIALGGPSADFALSRAREIAKHIEDTRK
jgi:hypothetical protein